MYKKPFSVLVIGDKLATDLFHICNIDYHFVVNIENSQLLNFISVILDNLLTE